MADFNSDFWHWYIVVLTTLSIIACFWLLHWMTAGFEKSDDEVEDTGHVWDGDLTELNNPLPRWWLGLFYITLFFSIIYLLLYPGMGKFQGYLNWSSAESYNQEMAQAEATTGPLFARYRQQEIATLAQDKDALRIGERLFANYCSTCHGSDARGARGFPNLRDEDWLWGGQPESIEASILDGRQGAMPAWGLPLGGEAGVAEVAEYVLSFSGRSTIDLLAEKGKKRYDIFCVACHGSEGQGNPALGAPRLSDNIWLYGGSISRIALSISEGRNGKMPAHRDFLGEDKVHLIAAYIYSLSNPTQ